jgi:hypothetical protein
MKPKTNRFFVKDSPTPIKRAYTSKTEEQYLAEMKSNGKKTSSDNIGHIFIFKGIDSWE